MWLALHRAISLKRPRDDTSHDVSKRPKDDSSVYVPDGTKVYHSLNFGGSTKVTNEDVISVLTRGLHTNIHNSEPSEQEQGLNEAMAEFVESSLLGRQKDWDQDQKQRYWDSLLESKLAHTKSYQIDLKKKEFGMKVDYFNAPDASDFQVGLRNYLVWFSRRPFQYGDGPSFVVTAGPNIKLFWVEGNAVSLNGRIDPKYITEVLTKDDAYDNVLLSFGFEKQASPDHPITWTREI